MSDKEVTAIVPTLSVRNGALAIEYYKQAFNALELMRNTSPDGEVVAELAIGSSRFLVADESPEFGNYSPESLRGTTVRMGLQVPDPDLVARKAIAAGGKKIYPVADQSYGYRVGRVADPFGHHWEIFKILTE